MGLPSRWEYSGPPSLGAEAIIRNLSTKCNPNVENGGGVCYNWAHHRQRSVRYAEGKDRAAVRHRRHCLL